MGNFHDYAEVAAATGLGTLDALFARNIAANKKVAIRNVIATAQDPGVVAGWCRFQILVTDQVTAAVIATFQVIVLCTAAGDVAQSSGDRRIHFNSGTNGCTITATVESLNAGGVATLAASGKYQ